MRVGAVMTRGDTYFRPRIDGYFQPVSEIKTHYIEYFDPSDEKKEYPRTLVIFYGCRTGILGPGVVMKLNPPQLEDRGMYSADPFNEYEKHILVQCYESLWAKDSICNPL